jgi:hypothetical protein
MSEATMIELVQRALDRFGIKDDVVAVGQFNPRGHVGGMFVGGNAGGSVGDRLGGSLAGGIGMAAGSLAGQRAVDQASGLPRSVLVAVSAERVYGFDAPTRRSDPRGIVFNLRRQDLEAKIHQRVNVRILELIDTASGDSVQLEGNRLPLTHSGDVIKALTG